MAASLPTSNSSSLPAEAERATQSSQTPAAYGLPRAARMRKRLTDHRVLRRPLQVRRTRFPWKLDGAHGEGLGNVGVPRWEPLRIGSGGSKPRVTNRCRAGDAPAAARAGYL